MRTILWRAFTWCAIGALAVEVVASEAVSALQKPRNPEKQGIFALSGLEFFQQKPKIIAISVCYTRFGPKINREF